MTGHNLANMPPEQRQAIEQDKQRWFEAVKMINKMPKADIKSWLGRQSDLELREDYRRRLNAIQNGRREMKN